MVLRGGVSVFAFALWSCMFLRAAFIGVSMFFPYGVVRLGAQVALWLALIGYVRRYLGCVAVRPYTEVVW